MEGGFLPEPAEQRPQPAWQQQQQPAGRSAPPPPPPPRPAAVVLADEHPEAHGGCSRCPSLTFNSEWLRAFGVVLCNQCRRGEQLISKSTARQRYSLSDGDLAGLGSLRKTNPHKKDWQAMHLFMESQVARVAHDKHGGAEGLQEHQQARLDARMQAKLRRREEEKRAEAAEAARLERIRRRIADDDAARAAGEGGASASGSEVEEI